MGTMKAIVIIPTYNERGNIERLITRLLDVFKKIKKWELEILVVDDNSPDKTAEIVEKEGKKQKNVRLLLRRKKVGLGAAYLAGMKQAFGKMGADAVLIMDADLSHNPIYIPRFLRLIENGAQFVVGSRYILGGSIAEDWSPYRKFLSIFGNKIVPLVLGKTALTDWTSGYRAVTKEVYKKVHPKLSEDKAEFRGYTFNISFAYHTVVSRFRTAEVPIKFVDRRSGKSKLGLEYLFHTPIFIFKTRLRNVLKHSIMRSITI